VQVHDIMSRDVITVPATMTVGDLADLFQRLNIHAAPVLGPAGDLVGIVAHDDILYGTMGGTDGAPESSARLRSTEGLLELDDLHPDAGDPDDPWGRPISQIMTEAAISVPPHTPLEEACRLMWTLRIHHLPVVEGGKVAGLVSSLDVCRAVAEGRLAG
jgi:CBS domain-containing protein